MSKIMQQAGRILLLAAILLIIQSCSKVSGPMALFKKLSPHDQYAQRLKDAGLDRSAMGTKWLQSAENSLKTILNITIPYKETGYFDAVKVPAAALRFEAKRGQKIRITIVHKPVTNYMIFADLWKENTGTEPKLLSSADSTTGLLEQSINETGKYILRLQPELLQSGEYTLTITSGPSIGFPVSASGKPRIESFWGADRDAGVRKHEGIDIFAPKGTPAIASANGTVTNVGENKLGGLVIFVRPDNEDYTLYYAHLSRQIAQAGQAVKLGDTLGLVGNTGNAAGGPTHLHFGIYTGSGAIDPIAFVDRYTRQPKPITADLSLLHSTARVKSRAVNVYAGPLEKAYVKFTLAEGNVVTPEAAEDGWLKIITPDGQNGFVQAAALTPATIIRSNTIKTSAPLLDGPDSVSASTKRQLSAGDKVELLGSYKNYQLVRSGEVTGWVEVK